MINTANQFAVQNAYLISAVLDCCYKRGTAIWHQFDWDWTKSIREKRRSRSCCSHLNRSDQTWLGIITFICWWYKRWNNHQCSRWLRGRSLDEATIAMRKSEPTEIPWLCYVKFPMQHTNSFFTRSISNFVYFFF